jgi:integrase
MSNGYIYSNGCRIKKHCGAFLANKRMSDITPAEIDKLIANMQKSEVFGRTINAVIQAIRVPYGYFCKTYHIVNQLSIVRPVEFKSKEQGLLTLEEVGKIILIKNEDPRSHAAVLLGIMCGLSSGEIRGLHKEDIDLDKKILFIRHNYVDHSEGVKSPKWGAIRRLPMPDPVVDSLKYLFSISRRGSPYVFFNDRNRSLPYSSTSISDGFKRILSSIGINEEERKSRNLTIRSSRNSFNIFFDFNAKNKSGTSWDKTSEGKISV